MWRLTSFLKRGDGVTRATFVRRWREEYAPALVAHPAVAGRLHHAAINLPIEGGAPGFPDTFDVVSELWFESENDARAAAAELAADNAVQEEIGGWAGPGCETLLGEVTPVVAEPDVGVRMTVAGEVADGWEPAEAQQYWRVHHVACAKTVPAFWNMLKLYTQIHGTPIAGVAPRYPLSADIGFVDLEQLSEAFQSEGYLTIIRPDELRFGKPGEMLAFLSRERIEFR